MSWMKPWEVWDEMDAQMEEWAKSMPKKKKKKPPNHYAQKGSCYILEYSKSSRAECKVCRGKVLKKELRVGKNVEMSFTGGYYEESVAQTMAPIWFHHSCFWGSSYRSHQHDPKRDNLRNFTGFDLLSVKDQQEVHLQVTGQPMSDRMISSAIESEKQREEEAKQNGVFVDSDPFAIAESLVEKWLYNVPKADEVKQLVKISGLTAQKGKAKKHDLLLLLHKQSFQIIPEVLKRALTKYLTAAELKEILGPLKLKVSGSKGQQVSRFVLYLSQNQSDKTATPPVSEPVAVPSEAQSDKENNPTVAANKTNNKTNNRKRTISDSSKIATTNLLSGLDTPLKKLKIQSTGEALVMQYIKDFCTKYLRVHDLKAILDELIVDRKQVSKKVNLIELLTSQDVSSLQELAFDSLVEFASPEDLEVLAKEVGLEMKETGSTEENIDTILSKMCDEEYIKID